MSKTKITSDDNNVYLNIEEFNECCFELWEEADKKNNVIIINTSRGGVINENDLDKALNEKTIKTKGGLKVELGGRGGYELLRIYGRKGYVEFYGRKER